MSRVIRLQDQVEEYLAQEASLVPLVPGGKTPLLAALPLVHGRPSWQPFQTTAATPEDVGLWFADYPGLNIGLVTGYHGFYVVDIDGPVIPASLADYHTTTVHTGRPGGGWHLYFKGSEGVSSAKIAIDGTSCEFKGVGSYVVAPVSVHASGTVYTFTRDLSAIQPLPGVLMDRLTLKDGDIPKGRGPDFRGRACLEQTWDRPLVVGERDKGLYALYQGLQTARHSESYARYWTERKNAKLAVPLTDQELKQIIKRGPEAKRPGHTYGVGCPWIKANLPWVDCRGCPYANKEALRMINAYELEQVQQGMSPAVLSVYIALVRQESRTGIRALSLSELEKQTGLSRHTVIAALQTLRSEGLA